MKLNNLFSSNMVFAHGKPIRFFGEGKGKIEISLAGQTKTTESNGGGWILEFPAMDCGGPYCIKTVTDEYVRVLENVYIGEVYLFSGQSNMEFKMRESNTPNEEYTASEMLRLFSADTVLGSDRFTASDGWQICSDDNIADWSALGYLVSKELCKSKGIAIGAIACYQGASVIESWVPRDSFSKIGIDIPIAEKHIDHTYKDFYAWNCGPVMYERFLSTLMPFSLNGVVWYQGESDTTVSEALVYEHELAELIRIWRKGFMDENLEFTVIQIADFDQRDDDGWHTVQKAQAEIQTNVRNVKTVISRDLCESDQIHPPTKTKLAKRIAKSIIE
ncbi:MAG: hypothetical protein IJY88_04150 [Clostridia bacterium]|nr:hypothetical protein [Clostridia bacterium]